jgi:hypothetical protein
VREFAELAPDATGYAAALSPASESAAAACGCMPWRKAARSACAAAVTGGIYFNILNVVDARIL